MSAGISTGFAPWSLAAAVAKVLKPYPSALRCVHQAIDHVLADPHTLSRYMQALQMDPQLLEVLRERIVTLRDIG